MPVIGTAGHVDHGKSTLVRALTGRDPDRWAEEKERGLTIDLGFAWTTLPSGVETGFVDVPGHERFIKNMLAGVDAITVALFVVAADEGWKPQSEEHLAILDLLGIDHGVVALTRADLVDPDDLELAMLDIDERLAGTSLAGSPIIPTAAPDGTGIEDLRRALDAALARSTVRDLGRPRMWVDRSFSMAGAGTVLTGTLVDGPLATDDVVTIFPDRLEGRIRSIQSHEKALERIGPGNRVAVSVVGIERTQVPRGAMVGRRHEWAVTRRFTADLTAVRGLGAPLKERGSFHLHLGSGSWSVQLRLLEGPTLESSGAALFELPEPLAIRWGDRLIVREVGRQAVVAGGRVLDPDPPQRARGARHSLASLRSASGPDAAADALLRSRGQATVEQLAAHTGGGIPHTAVAGRRSVFSKQRVEELLEQAATVVSDYHLHNPLRPGIPKARLAERLSIDPDDLDDLIGRSDRVELAGADARSIGYGVDLTTTEQAAWDAARTALEQAGTTPPSRSELGLAKELEHALVRSGQLVEVPPDFLYLAATIEDVVAQTRAIDAGFTVADFRDSLGITRKHAIPLLEWMDSSGITRRDGDVRRMAD